MGVPKQLGARRYAQDIVHLTRCRSGIVLDTGFDNEIVAIALQQIDSLIATLGILKRRKEADESGEFKVSQ
jgi:DNA-binding sugar fermentation-stimulating protein